MPPFRSSPSPAVTAAAASRTALLTLGRLPVALEIARALHAGGWRVVVAEPLALHLCRASNAVDRCRTLTAPNADAARYLDELVRIVAEEDVSLVVPLSEETVHVAALHGRLPAHVTLACPPRAALLELHDKWRFAERARALGLPVPASALASSEAGARLAASGAHVVKPRLSCSGVGVTLHEAPGALDAARASDALVVQAYLPGAACCAQALAVDGALRELVVYRSLLEAGSVSVTFERIAAPAAVRHCAERVIGACGHAGLIAFDFIADEAGRWHVIECNPRATSGVHLLAPEAIVAALRSLDRPVSDGARERAPVGARRQEFWSALIELEGKLLRGRFAREDWARLLTTRDVDWSARDPLPFLTMALTGAPLLWRAIRARRPVTEVTMLDMGWYDAPAPRSPRQARAPG